MVDLFLFLNKPLLDKVPNGSAYHATDVYYGGFPQGALDAESEYIKSQTKLVPTLVS